MRALVLSTITSLSFFVLACADAPQSPDPVTSSDAGADAKTDTAPPIDYDAAAPAEPDSAPVACTKPPAEDAGSGGDDCLPIGTAGWCDQFCGRPDNFYCHGAPPASDCVRGPDQGVRTGWCCAPSAMPCTRAREYDSACGGKTARACASNEDGSPSAPPTNVSGCTLNTGAIPASVGATLYCCGS